MRPHPRIRKTIKWGGLTLAVLIMAVAVLSRGVSSRIAQRTTTRLRNLMISQGIGSYWSVPMSNMPQADPTKLMWGRNEVTPPQLSWWPVPGKPPGTTLVECPLWVFSLASLLASALAWRLDTVATRRLKFGMCPKCSYPRTGLAPSSPCPECGAAAPSA